MPSMFEKLSQVAAELLLQCFDTNYLNVHQEIPLKDHELLHLSRLTLHQQRYLIQHAHQFLKVDFDPGALRRKLTDIDAMNRLREMEDRYLLLGAPLALMRRLFGMHASEFSRRRQLLNLRGAGTGRPRQCRERVEHNIWHQWEAHKDLDERQRFLAVADVTGEDLITIWSALREYLDV